MTLAELIAADVLRSVGFREPDRHPKWTRAVGASQERITNSVESMSRVAIDNQRPSMRNCLDYEVRSSWWAGWISLSWFQELAALYYAAKVNRKYARFVASIPDIEEPTS